MSSKNRLKTADIDLWWESLEATISDVFGILFSLLTVISLTFFLPPVEVGLYFFYLSISYLISQIPKGVSTAVKKKGSSTGSSKEKNQYFTASAVLTALAFIFLISLSGILPLFNEYISVTITYIGLGAMVVRLVGSTYLQLCSSYLSSVGKPGLALKIKSYLGNGTKLSLISLGLYIMPRFEVALIMYGLAYAIAGTLIYYYAVEEKYVSKPSKSQIEEILEFSKWSIPNSLLNDIYHRFDTILLGVAIGSVAVSYYDVPLRLVYFSAALGTGVSAASTIKFSGMFENGDKLTSIASEATAVSSLSVYPFLAVVLLNPEAILGFFFGEAYTAAKWFLIGLTVQQVLQAYRKILESAINASDEPKQITNPSLITFIINVVTAIPLVIYMGGIGVIISTLFSDVVRLILLEKNIHGIFDSYVIHRLMLKQILAGAAVYGLFILINTILPFQQGYTYFIIQTISIFVIYLIILHRISPVVRDVTTSFKSNHILFRRL